MKPMKTECTNIMYFVENRILRGTIVASVEPNKLQRSQHLADRWSKCPQVLCPIGIILQDVVNIDLMKSHINWNKYEVTQGSKVTILTKGDVTVKMNKRLKLPHRQPIYADQKTDSLTWRRVGPKVGYVSYPQDQDGYVTIHVDFDRS